MITSMLYNGIGNRLYNIVDLINISNMTNIPYYLSDKYCYDIIHNSNFKYKNNIYYKLNFEYLYSNYDDFIKNYKCHLEYFYENLEDEKRNRKTYISDNNNIILDYGYNSLYTINNFNLINNNKDNNIILINNKRFELTKYNFYYYNDLFVNKNLLDEIYNKYKKYLKNSVCLHIRRNDFLEHFNNTIKDNIYYYKALKKLEEFKQISNILVFSDDLEWCRKNILDPRIIFIDEEDYICLYLGTLCENFIATNYSTFNFWMIILNMIKNKIIIIENNNYSFIEQLFIDNTNVNMNEYITLVYLD